MNRSVKGDTRLLQATTVLRAAATTIALTIALAACSDPGTDTDPESSPEAPSDQNEDDADDGPDGDDAGGGEAGAAEVSDLLNPLHDLEIPEPGTAWAVVDGEELTYDDVTCNDLDADSATGHFLIHAAGTREDGSPTSVRLERKIDPDDVEIQESEIVQIIVDVEGETGTIRPSSMVMQQIWDGEREWDRGEGELPIIRTDGNTVTAVGTSEAQAFHVEKGAIEGDFEIAVSCE